MAEDIIEPIYGGLQLLDEGIYLFRVERIWEAEASTGSPMLWMQCSVVEPADWEGVMAFDSFPLEAKRDFGLRRLLGFVIKAGVLEEKGYSKAYLKNPEFLASLEKVLPGRLFGAQVRHRYWEGQERANLVQYFTEEEVRAILGASEPPEEADEEISFE